MGLKWVRIYHPDTKFNKIHASSDINWSYICGYRMVNFKSTDYRDPLIAQSIVEGKWRSFGEKAYLSFRTITCRLQYKLELCVRTEW